MLVAPQRLARPSPFWGAPCALDRRAAQCAIAMQADDDAASRIRELELAAREAKERASDAMNAEARLRQMVAQAEATATREITARLDAEEKTDDLRDELEALRELYASDVSALQAEVDELTAQCERASGTDGGDDAGNVDARIAELTDELAETRERALRAEADLEDTAAELEAVRALSSQDAAAHEAVVEELREELRTARAELADPVLGGRDEEAQRTIGELRSQVSDLLAQLEGLQEGAVAELMTLRPKLAALEEQVRAQAQARDTDGQ